MVNNPGFSRRVMLGGSAAVVASGLWARVARAASGEITASALLDYACDQTIPATQTPGALAVKVPAFVQVALKSGMLGTKGDELTRLAAELDANTGGRFMALPDTARLAALTRHDAACFASREAMARSAWPAIKKLILMGYYTSEVGASQELQYNLDPGGFHGDLPYRRGDRAQATDWFGVMI